MALEFLAGRMLVVSFRDGNQIPAIAAGGVAPRETGIKGRNRMAGDTKLTETIPHFSPGGCTFEKRAGSEGRVQRHSGEAARLGTMPQNRRCGSAESTRPRAHTSAPKRALPWWPNAAPSGFPQALPEGEVLPRLRRSIRKPCRRRFAGSPTPTPASPLSPESQHYRGTGFLNEPFAKFVVQRWGRC